MLSNRGNINFKKSIKEISYVIYLYKIHHSKIQTRIEKVAFNEGKDALSGALLGLQWWVIISLFGCADDLL